MAYCEVQNNIFLPSISRSGNEKLGPSNPKLPKREIKLSLKIGNTYICYQFDSEIIRHYPLGGKILGVAANVAS